MGALVDTLRCLVVQRDLLARELVAAIEEFDRQPSEPRRRTIAAKMNAFDSLERELADAGAMLDGTRDRQTEPRQPAEDGGAIVSADAAPAATAAPVPTSLVKICPLCHGEYWRTSNRQKICPACRAKADDMSVGELLARAAKGLPIDRPFGDRTCGVETCRHVFTPKVHTQRICDDCLVRYGNRGPGRINRAIVRAAARAASPIMTTRDCVGPSLDGREPCPDGKQITRKKQARGPLRCPDCHLEHKRRMVRRRLPALREEQAEREARITAAAPPTSSFEGRLQAWRESKSQGSDHVQTASAARGRLHARGAGAAPARVRRRAPRASAETPMPAEVARDATPAPHRGALEATQPEPLTPDVDVEAGDTEELEAIPPAPARSYDPRRYQTTEKSYRRNTAHVEHVERGGSWWTRPMDRDEFSSIAEGRAAVLRHSKEADIVRTPREPNV